ncbi:MAG: polyphosphate kinase 2 family protein [Chloroflexi bacterium]|nr:polyphosphate kinase 2 family protein [Chloroflexota bacterium]
MSPRRRPLVGRALAQRLLVKPATSLDLESIDPADTLGHDKQAGAVTLAATTDRLGEAQERLWASKAGAVLIVLQGIDTSGKGGTIRHVMGAFDPQGCRVASFGVPSPEELAHEYLWRIHRHTPARGMIAIFDRSHYEDVLVVRVHGLVPQDVWRSRYDQIVAFERHLAENGTTILKFFLHISRDEQRKRLQARIDAPDKRWKFRRGDLDERRLWDEYRAAFAEALTRCSTDFAPWYVIPADRKWFRDLAVAEIVAHTFDRMKLEYPQGEVGIESLVVP